LIRNSAAPARANAIKASIGNESVGTVGGGTPGPRVCVAVGGTDVEVAVGVAVEVDVGVGVAVVVGVLGSPPPMTWNFRSYTRFSAENVEAGG